MSHTIYVINARPHKVHSVSRRVYFPTIPLYLATILKGAGYCIRLVDRWLEKTSFDSLIEEIKQERPTVAVIYFSTTEVPEAVAIAEAGKTACPDLQVVAVGPHPTMYPSQTSADPAFDYVVQGDAEDCILPLVQYIQNGPSNASLPPNVWSRNACLGRPTSLPEVHFVDLNDLPLFDFDLVDIGDYINRNVFFMTGDPTPYRVFRFSASRGCLNKCTFCTDPFKGYQRMSNETILRHLDHIVRHCDPQILFFDDPEFFLMKEETLKLLDLLEERYTFRCITTSRANEYREDYLSKALMQRFKSRWIAWDCGAETGNLDRMVRLKKGITIDQLRHVADQAGECGARAGFSFMVGMPGETEQEMLETVYLMEDLKRRAAENAFVTYQYYQPIGPTMMSAEAARYGFPEARSLRDWQGLFDPRTGGTSVHLHLWIQRPEFVEYLMLVVKYVINNIYPPAEESLAAMIKQSWELRKRSGDWKDLWETEQAAEFGLSYFTPKEVWQSSGSV